MTLVTERRWAPPEALQENYFGLTETDRVAVCVAHPDDTSVMEAFAVGVAIAAVGPDNVYSYVAADGENSTRGNWLAVHVNRERRGRAQAEFARLGGYPEHVELPNLGDGKLASRERYLELVDNVGNFIASRGITVALTLGKEGGEPGGNGHSDHIAVHRATVEAAGGIAVWGLNTSGRGDVRIPGGSEEQLTYKFIAVAANDDQFPMVPYTGGELPDGWTIRGGFALPPETSRNLAEYEQYFTAETYDRY